MTYQSIPEHDALTGLSNLFAVEYYSELDTQLRDYWEEGTEGIEREAGLETEPALETISELLSWRTGVLVPYLHTLGNKQDTGHNCSLCSGRCDMQHTMRMKELEESGERFLKMLHALPLSSLAALASSSLASLSSTRALRTLTTAAEMIQAERAYLIPQIHQARKDIYADAARED